MSHRVIVGGRRLDRQAALTGLELPSTLATVSAHRNLRGPYTAAGTLLRQLTPDVLSRRPELAVRHDIELLSVAPELRDVLPNSRQTLTSMALPAERTRFYARLRTFRTAHGLVEFFRDGLPEGQWTIVIEDVDQAEFTDQEFLTAALRRWDPSRLTLVLGLASVDELEPALLTAIDTYASVIEVSPENHDEIADGRDYVLSDGTSDDPAVLQAYLAEPVDVRARWHDERAIELAGRDEFSLTLGALSWHREHGSDAARTGVRSLYEAQDHCLCLGFYDAVVDYATRAMALIDPVAQEETWWPLAIELGLAWS